MCEQMGTEPVENEIPPAQHELLIEAQEALEIFNACPDSWEGMAGTYLGKRIECLPVLFDIYEIDKLSQRYVFEFFKIIEEEFYKYIEIKRKIQESTDSGKRKSYKN